jgi:predicted nucleic acid-binding Zn finger protein
MKVSCNNCQVSVINGHICHEATCYEGTIFKRGGKDFKQYEVITLDVWGSKKEGYEVNAAYSTGNKFIVPLNCDDKRIIKHLKALGYINKKTRFNSLKIDGDDYSLNIDWNTRDNFSPCLQLRRL